MRNRVLKKRICAYMLLAAFWISQIQFYAPKAKAQEVIIGIDWAGVAAQQAEAAAYAANSAALSGVNFAAAGLGVAGATETILSLGDKWAVANGYESLIDWYDKNQPTDNSSLGYKAVWSAGNFIANARLTNQMKLLGDYIKNALFGEQEGGTPESPVTESYGFSGYNVGDNLYLMPVELVNGSGANHYRFISTDYNIVYSLNSLDENFSYYSNLPPSSISSDLFLQMPQSVLGKTSTGYELRIAWYISTYYANPLKCFLFGFVRNNSVVFSTFNGRGAFIQKLGVNSIKNTYFSLAVYPQNSSTYYGWGGLIYRFDTDTEGLYNSSGFFARPSDNGMSGTQYSINLKIWGNSLSPDNIEDWGITAQYVDLIPSIPSEDSADNVNFSGNYDVEIADILGAMGQIEFSLDNTNINLQKIVTQLQQQSADLGGVNTSIADIINAIAGLQVAPGTYETIKTGIETLEEESPEVKPIVINDFPYTLEELIEALQGDDVILTDDNDNIHVVGLPEIIETITETPIPPESQSEIMIRHIIDVGDGVNPGINIDSTPDERPTPQPSTNPTPIPTVTPDEPTPTPENPSPTPEQDKLDELGAALTSRFPFSIPWDIVRGIKMLIAPAQAPVFEFDPFAASGAFPDGFAAPIRVDFADFPYVAFVTRWISTIAFFIGLASATKILIWS